MNSATRSKENKMTPDEYFQLRLADMRVMSEHKYWEAGQEDMLHKLAEAAVTVDFVQVKPSRVVTLNLEPAATGARETSSKGAAFILYNCARLASLQAQFSRKTKDGVYPPLPEPANLDLGVLKDDEEWGLLFNYLLEYPSLLLRVGDVGCLAPHRLCSFLSGLSSLFSVYYRRVRVLLEPKANLLPLIHSRIYLLSAIEQVIHNILDILNIEKVDYM